MKEKLIKAGVNNLRAFGYPHCTEENILKDDIYKAFFISMLEDNKGKGGAEVDAEISALILLCQDNEMTEETKPRKGPVKGTKAPIKYRGPNGETWSGRGKPARWIVAAGGDKERFRIDAPTT